MRTDSIFGCCFLRVWITEVVILIWPPPFDASKKRIFGEFIIVSKL
jgi:hypothetical protein